MLKLDNAGDRAIVTVPDLLEQIEISVNELQDAYESIQQQMLLLPACNAVAQDGTGCMQGRNLEAVLLLVDHLRMHLDNELDVMKCELQNLRSLLGGALASGVQ